MKYLNFSYFMESKFAIFSDVGLQLINLLDLKSIRR